MVPRGILSLADVVTVVGKAGSREHALHRNGIRKMRSPGGGRGLLTLSNGLEFTVSGRRAPMIHRVLRCGK